MPLFAFAKERFDPYLTLPKSLLVGEGLLIAFHAIQIVRQKGTMYMPTSITFGAIPFHRASIAGGRISAIVHLLRPFQAIGRA